MGKMHNPPHPGEVLRDTVLAELSVSEFARKLGVSRVALSRVVNGRAAVSAEMAIRLQLWDEALAYYERSRQADPAK